MKAREPGRLHLTSAEETWETKSEWVWDPVHRVAGNRKHVIKFLNSSEEIDFEIDDEWIDENCYTVLNTSEGEDGNSKMRKAFKKEIKNYKEYMDGVKESRNNNLLDAAMRNDSKVTITGGNRRKTRRSTSRTVDPEKQAKKFSEAYAGLRGDKVLNVTDLDSTGKGYRTISRPGEASELITVKNINLASKTAGGFQNALELLDLNVKKYMKRYRENQTRVREMDSDEKRSYRKKPTANKKPVRTNLDDIRIVKKRTTRSRRSRSMPESSSEISSSELRESISAARSERSSRSSSDRSSSS